MRNKLKTLITLFPIIIIILIMIYGVVNAPDNYHGINPRIQQVSDIKSSPFEFLFFVSVVILIIAALNKIHKRK